MVQSQDGTVDNCFETQAGQVPSWIYKFGLSSLLGCK